jgi:hypothetical protein
MSEGADVFDPEKVIIDDSRVLPVSMKDDAEYMRRRQDIERRLRAPRAIETFCTHEAGHLIYFRRAGFTQFDFLGPTIAYDGKRFDDCLAAVNPPKLGRNHFYDDDFLIELARGAVAGGVFVEVRLHYPEIENGDGADWVLFENHCRRAQRQDVSRTFNPEERWRQARDEVKADLENHVITDDEIQRAEDEVRHKCFPVG